MAHTPDKKKKGTKADKYVKVVKKAVKDLPKRKKGVYGKKSKSTGKLGAYST